MEQKEEILESIDDANAGLESIHTVNDELKKKDSPIASSADFSTGGTVGDSSTPSRDYGKVEIPEQATPQESTSVVAKKVRPVIISQEQVQDNLKKVFSAEDKKSQAFWTDRATREKLYNNLSKQGYDIDGLRESGERFVTSKTRLPFLAKSASETQDPAIVYEYARALGDVGDNAGAFSLYTELIKNGSQSADVYKGLAHSLHKLGSDKEAQVASQIAQDLTPITENEQRYMKGGVALQGEPSEQDERQNAAVPDVAAALERITPMYSQAKGLVEGLDNTTLKLQEAKELLTQDKQSVSDLFEDFGSATLRTTAALGGGAVSYLMNTTPLGMAFLEATHGLTGEGTKKGLTPVVNAIAKAVTDGKTEFTADEAVGILGMPLTTAMEKMGVKDLRLKDAGFIVDMIAMGVIAHAVSKPLIKGMTPEQVKMAGESATKIIKGENVTVEELRNINKFVYENKSFRESFLNPYNDLQKTAKIYQKAEKVNTIDSDIKQAKSPVTQSILTEEHAKEKAELDQMLNEQGEAAINTAKAETNNEIITEYQDELKSDLLNVKDSENKAVIENEISAVDKLKETVEQPPVEPTVEQPKPQTNEQPAEKTSEGTETTKAETEVTWYRGVDKYNEGKGDKFYSSDESTAGDFGVKKAGDKSTIEKISEKEIPKNPLIVSTKEQLAEKMNFPEEDIYKRGTGFDEKAKEYAQSKGHDGIIYEEGQLGNSELHLFEPIKPKPDALQEPSAEKILPGEPKETGITGSERRGVEPVKQGKEPAGEITGKEKTAPPGEKQSDVTPKAEVKTSVNEEVKFIHAGATRKGKITGESEGKIQIESTESWNKGFKYSIAKADLLKEGETASTRLNKSFDEKVDEVAEKVKKKLKAKGLPKGTKTSGLDADAVVDAAAKLVKAAYKAGSDIHKAIDDAVKYIKDNWDPAWGKFEEAEYKKAFEEANVVAIDKKLAEEELPKDVAKMEQDVFGSATTEPTFKKTIAGTIFGAINKLQEATVVKAVKKIGDGIDKAFEKGLISKNPVIRNTAKVMNTIARQGLTRDKIKATDELFGGIERAKGDAGTMNDLLRKVVDNNKESLEKVHRVLDPALYEKKSFKEFSDDLQKEMGDDAFKELNDADIQELFDAHSQNIQGKETALTYDDLNPAEKKLHDLIRQVNDVTHKINFVTGRISHQTYLENKGKYIGRAYDSFEIPTDAAKEMREAAKKINSGIYKQRTEIDDWKLEHKITDPVYLTAKRLYQTGVNKAVADYTTWVKENKPDFISDFERKGFTKLGTGYGELSNKWVADNVAQDLKGFFFTNQGVQAVYDAFKAYDKIPIRQFYKKLFTVFNPGTQLGNITGDNVFGFLVGVDPITLNKNLAWATKESTAYGSTYRYLLDRGLLKSDLTKEDLTNTLKNYNDLIDNASKSKNPLKWLKEKAENIYSSMDDMYKMAAFRSLMEQGISSERAIEITQAAFQNSKRIPKVYDFAAKTPVIGNPFARWGADLARIVKTSATERPLQTIGFLATLQGIAYAGSKLSGETDAERKIRESRPGAPRIPLPFGLSIPLSIKVGNSELNIARLISPFFIYSGIEDNDATQAWMKFSPYPVDFVTKSTNPNGELAAFIGKNINDPLANFIQTIPGINADFRGKPILDPNETVYKESTLTSGEKTVNALRFLARAYIPYANETTSLYDAAMGQEDYFGRQKNVGQALLRLVGVKVEKYGEEQYIKALTNKVESSAYEFMNNGKKISTVKGLLEAGKIDEKTALMRLAPIIEQQAKLISKVQENIEVAKEKMTQEQLDAIIEDMRGLNSAVNNYEEIKAVMPDQE